MRERRRVAPAMFKGYRQTEQCQSTSPGFREPRLTAVTGTLMNVYSPTIAAPHCSSLMHYEMTSRAAVCGMHAATSASQLATGGAHACPNKVHQESYRNVQPATGTVTRLQHTPPGS
eukprot:GHRR01009897.1.p3 GENE.GHRR01009897.1~~GHRR01009897.1.p3  ORF type:complete len:117 (-),score=12.98 GHRR01009897.1:2332-2682(-)